jgi:hypothetical protein
MRRTIIWIAPDEAFDDMTPFVHACTSRLATFALIGIASAGDRKYEWLIRYKA